MMGNNSRNETVFKQLTDTTKVTKTMDTLLYDKFSFNITNKRVW